VSKDLTERYKEVFAAEAEKNITRLNDLLLNLEKNMTDKEIIDEIFRITHLLKGSSAMIGVDAAVKIAHEMEDILVGLKRNEIMVTSELIDVLLDAVDYMSKVIDAFLKREEYPIKKNIISKLREIARKKSENKNRFLKQLKEKIGEEEKDRISYALSKGLNLYIIEAKLAKGALAAVNAFMVMEKISEQGDVITTIPNGDKISSGSFNGKLVLLAAHKQEEDIYEIFKDIPESKVKCTRISVSDLGIPLPSNFEHRSKSELENIEALIKKVESMLQEKKSVTISKKNLMNSIKLIEEVKVKVEDLDRIFTLIGELVLIRNRFLRLGKTRNLSVLTEVISALNQTTNDLYREVLKIRLISIGQVFNVFPKLVRDLARKMGKEIDFIIEGGDASLDRTVLEELIDPLSSILRNAVDHGIEPPEERVAKGKPRVGTVKISARQEGDFTLITVEDDGRGIDTEVVKKVAVKKGLIPQSIVGNLSDEEALNLIFLPGFSTKESLSVVSGRGMGLNAIKQRAESLGGDLEVVSKKDKGTKFTLIMPTNVTILRVLLVKVNDQTYAVPSSIVSSLLKLDDKSLKFLGEQPIIIYRDNIIPVYNLSDLLEVPSHKNDYGVILKKRDKLYCIAVSDLLGFEEVVVKSSGNEKILNMPWLSSITILSDGKIALIIDPWHLIERRGEQWRGFQRLSVRRV